MFQLKENIVDVVIVVPKQNKKDLIYFSKECRIEVYKNYKYDRIPQSTQNILSHFL